MQYSFLTGNQCPQPYLSAGLSGVGGRGSPLVRWEEDEHVQDDMKMTDGEKKRDLDLPIKELTVHVQAPASFVHHFEQTQKPVYGV